MVFTKIDKPYIHGYEHTKGDRHVEVVRTDTECGHWAVFRRIAGRVVKRDAADNNAKSYLQAMREARAFLNDKGGPYETWPTQG